MRHQWFVPTLAVVVAAGNASAADVEAKGSNFTAISYFTAELNDGVPGDKIERAHLGMERVVLYTEWRDLEAKPYLKEVRVYDPYDALVYSWQYEIIPVDGAFNSWFWWCLCEDRDLPGVWRFEVDLDGEAAFANSITVREGE